MCDPVTATLIGSAVGLGGTVYAANKQEKAAKQAANTMATAAEPGVEAQRYAFPQMQEIIDSFYRPLASGADVLPTDPTLAKSHAANLADINAATASNVKRALQANAIDPARAVGAELWAGTQGAKAVRDENNSYASTQRQAGLGLINTLFGSLSTMAGQGQGSAQLMSQAAMLPYEASTQGTNDIMSGLGSGLGYWAAQNLQDQYLAKLNALRLPQDFTIDASNGVLPSFTASTMPGYPGARPQPVVGRF